MIFELESELRILATLLRGTPDTQAYLIGALTASDFSYIKQSWQIVVDLIKNRLPLPSGQTLSLDDQIKDTPEAGLASSVDTVALLTDNDVMYVVELVLDRKRSADLASKIHDAVKPMLDHKQRPVNTAEEVSSICTSFLSTIQPPSQEEGLGTGYDPDKFLEDTFSTDPDSFLPTGFEYFDMKCGGFLPGEIFFIAAPSSQGKTTFMLKLAKNVVMYSNKPRTVAYHGLEMTRKKAKQRFLTNLSGVPNQLLRQPHLMEQVHKDQIVQATKAFHNRIAATGSKFLIRDFAGYSVNTLIGELTAQHHDLVLIDYINLMNLPPNLAGWEGLKEISKILKQIAIKFNCVIGSAVQLDERTMEVRYSRAIRENTDVLIKWAYESGEDEEQELHVQAIVDKGRDIGKFSFWLKFIFPLMDVESAAPQTVLRKGDQPSKDGDDLQF